MHNGDISSMFPVTHRHHTMTKAEREAKSRVFYQIVWKNQGMNILGAVYGPCKTLAEAKRELKTYDKEDFRGGYVIRKVTYEII